MITLDSTRGTRIVFANADGHELTFDVNGENIGHVSSRDLIAMGYHVVRYIREIPPKIDPAIAAQNAMMDALTIPSGLY